MTTDRLKIYNGILRLLGERRLASLSETGEAKRVLDDIWDDGLVDSCLEQGFWNFATRTIEIEYSPSIEPDFGYRYAFDKPDDYIRTVGVAQDEFFNVPLTQYTDEAGYWFSDLQTMWVRYVSNDDAYGLNFALWPETFNKFVQAQGAAEAAPRLVQNNTKIQMIDEVLTRARKDARSKDAMNEPARFMPTGSWASARRGRLSRIDRLGRNLIG